jgi:threonine dehydrogenase-like Zn-dependent dehydrogenase
MTDRHRADVGEDVHLVMSGQRAVIPTHLFCGICNDTAFYQVKHSS